jgi:hypothetical protein
MSVDRVPEVAVGTDEPLARSARMHAGWLQLALSISGVILIKMKWFIGIKFWCPWPESNQHSLRNSILSRARLPIPPQGLFATPAEKREVAKPAEYSGQRLPVNPCRSGRPRGGGRAERLHPAARKTASADAGQ